MTVQYRKQCDCQSTSSGPRLISSCCTDVKTHALMLTVTLVNMACDACDAAWREVDLETMELKPLQSERPSPQFQRVIEDLIREYSGARP